MRLDESVIKYFALGKVFKNQVPADVFANSAESCDRVLAKEKPLAAALLAFTAL